MLKFFRSLLSSPSTADPAPAASPAIEPPGEIAAPGVGAFLLKDHLMLDEGMPHLDWQAVAQWVDSIESPEIQAKAWTDCGLAWQKHLSAALGEAYTLARQDDVVLLSSLEPNVVRATLDYMVKTQRRIVQVLDGIAQVPEYGTDLLIVFDDEDTYYRYVAHYYPEPGEFATSGGMYLNQGGGHFVTRKADLSAIEPIIAHEMTHECLSHLPIPQWLNEGLAVNTEQRVSRISPPTYPPREMQQKHLNYWDAAKIQEFWSGKSFYRTDDGNPLSYDLAQKIVAQLAADWNIFRAFVLSADAADGGASVAAEQFGLDLGEVAAAFTGLDPHPDWAPNPGAWPPIPS